MPSSRCAAHGPAYERPVLAVPGTYTQANESATNAPALPREGWWSAAIVLGAIVMIVLMTVTAFGFAHFARSGMFERSLP